MTQEPTGYNYEVVENWAKPPQGWSLDDVVGVVADAKDRIYVFNRSSHPMMIFDREGNFLDSWGEEIFNAPHNVRIGPDGLMYCVDYGDHTVRKLTSEGELLLTLGSQNKSSNTGAVGVDYRTIKQVAGPFNKPTDVAFGPSGELYVSDGYGNARIHTFSQEGELLSSWGEVGDGPRQFHLPHNVWVDPRQRLYVCDRENSRIQILTLKGDLITQWEDVNRPTCIYIDGNGNVFVTELGYRKESMFPGATPPLDRNLYPRITKRDLDGKVLAEWGKGADGCAPGKFFAPHTVCADSKGDLYVGEVTGTVGAPSGCHALQKFRAN